MAWITKNSAGVRVSWRSEPYLTDGMKRELESKYAHQFPWRQAMTLHVLHAIQDRYRWVPPQAVEEAAEFLGIPAAQVYDTATFYEEFALEPRGRYTIWLCDSVSCEIMGQPKLLNHLVEKLGVGPGETTPDGKFTLLKVECLGACSGSPVCLVNEKLHEDLSIDNLARILASLE